MDVKEGERQILIHTHIYNVYVHCTSKSCVVLSLNDQSVILVNRSTILCTIVHCCRNTLPICRILRRRQASVLNRYSSLSIGCHTGEVGSNNGCWDFGTKVSYYRGYYLKVSLLERCPRFRGCHVETSMCS